MKIHLYTYMYVRCAPSVQVLELSGRPKRVERRGSRSTVRRVERGFTILTFQAPYIKCQYVHWDLYNGQFT